MGPRLTSALVVLAACATFAPGPVRAEDPPASGAPAAPAVPRPEGDAYVVLNDGTLLTDGEVTKTDETVLFRPAGGSERTIRREDVSVAVSGGKRVVRGEEEGLRIAWLAHLQAKHLAAIPSKKPADAPAEARVAWWRDVLAAADACAALKMVYAAHALLAEGLDAGTWDAAAQQRALEWEPLEFPMSPEDSEKAQLLATWAREIVPLGGRWVLRKDGADDSKRSKIWSEEAIALRTRNILLFTRDREPGTAGKLLRQAELTIRALEAVFGRPDVDDPDPLEIRLFEDRKQYLTEEGGRGYAPMWSAGYFSPGDGVSRFYPDRRAKGQLDERELYRVVTHELTHHWLEMRALAGAMFDGAGDSRGGPGVDVEKLKERGEQPGHWIVEGVATFVESQALSFRRNALTMDDAKSDRLKDAARMSRGGLLIPMERFLDISPAGFGNLSDAPKRGNENVVNTERGVFYDQGGALAFFLMNRRGEEGRKLFLQYLRDVYGSRMKPKSWTRLGYSAPADLDRDFKAFLASLK